jgi:hypothetical protein
MRLCTGVVWQSVCHENGTAQQGISDGFFDRAEKECPKFGQEPKFYASERVEYRAEMDRVIFASPAR